MQIQATYRDIWQIAYPLIIGNVAQTLIAVSDTAFMGRVGETELAAIGYVSLLYLILFMFGFSYTKGTQILIARKQGEGYPKAIGLILDNTFVVLGVFALILMAVVLLFSRVFLATIIENPDVLAACIEFLDWRAYGFILSFAGSIMLAYFMGIGRTKLLIWAIGSMSLINILLNYVLIFGKLGAPVMGIKGAALASNIAEAVAFIIMFIGAARSDLYRTHQIFKFRKISILIIRRISNLSLPLVYQSFFGLSGWFVFFTLIEKMGEQALAVSNVVKMIYMFVGIPTYGFATAATTVVSNVYGQKRYNEVNQVIKRIVLLSFLFSLAIAIVLGVIPKLILMVFTEDPQLVQASLSPLYTIIVALLLYSISTVLFNGIVSIGSVKTSMVIETITIVLYLLYIYFIFYHTETTLFKAWTSEWFYWTIIAILSYTYLKMGKWKKRLA